MNNRLWLCSVIVTGMCFSLLGQTQSYADERALRNELGQIVIKMSDARLSAEKREQLEQRAIELRGRIESEKQQPLIREHCKSDQQCERNMTRAIQQDKESEIRMMSGQWGALFRRRGSGNPMKEYAEVTTREGRRQLEAGYQLWKKECHGDQSCLRTIEQQYKQGRKELEGLTHDYTDRP